MQSSIITIGNSQGVRLPKALLAQTDIDKDVRLSVVEGGILISPVRRVRQGWEDVLTESPTVAECQDMRTLSNAFDDTEWTW